MTKLIILDRDGVINQDSDQFIKSVHEFVLLPNSVSAIVALKKAGYTVAIATNQSGIARGLYRRADLHAMHMKLQSQLMAQGAAVDWIAYSPYLHETPCRKPNAGMYRSIAWRFGLPSLTGVPVVGDSWRDLAAALSVGSHPILVKTGKGAQTAEQQAEVLANASIPVVEDLAAAVESLGVSL
ncbi:MAG: D-glycero-beta-D-manno-heptose 1,7-bisphosphate 7-phosphatase [Gammaproteobacteria bacterium]|nr:D-glycero-beta-D-manno-heptose 1,7-bisphosphate 7-phosphatase [Gammaproteobacteria bacterium]